MLEQLLILTLALVPVQDDDGREAVAPADEKVEIPAPPAAEIAAWDERDLEARWVYWKSNVAEDSQKKALWMRWLASRKQFEVLEWDALSNNAWAEAGMILTEFDAPQWPRVALWHLKSSDSHTWGAARSAFESKPAVGLAWLELHMDRLDEAELGVYTDKLKPLTEDRAVVTSYLPPLDSADVFRHLKPGSTIVELGPEKLAAVPGVRYLHQIERAISILTCSKRRDPAFTESLERLTWDPNESVRRAAYLAYSRLESELVPVATFLRVVHDPQESPGVRSAALAGLSYGPAYRVLPELTLVARDPEHPAWNVAISRIGELGDMVTLRLLDVLDPASLGDRAALLATAAQSIRARFTGGVDQARFLLLRLAYATVSSHELSTPLTETGLPILAEWAREEAVRTVLGYSADGSEIWEPTGAFGETELEELRAQLRVFARQALR